MTENDILRFRLASHLITRGKLNSPADVVSHMGAIQAQDYGQAKYAIGCRMVQATNADIEQAINDKRIIRTWALRGTLHIVAAADIHWLLPLVAPAIISRYQPQFKKLELHDSAFTKVHHTIVQLLQNGRQLTRKELFDGLEHHKISTTGLRGTYILYKAGWQGIICLGPMKGKQDTYTLLDEWLPKVEAIAGEEALAELAKRYFQSHGPATFKDFISWSGLSFTDGRVAFESIRTTLTQIEVSEQQYWIASDVDDPGVLRNKSFLLPGFDEYLLGYNNRSLILDSAYGAHVLLNNGIFKPIIITNGKVTGTWSKVVQKNQIIVVPKLFDQSKINTVNLAAEIKKIVKFYTVK